jgi:hypothetical protein
MYIVPILSIPRSQVNDSLVFLGDLRTLLAGILLISVGCRIFPVNPLAFDTTAGYDLTIIGFVTLRSWIW